MDLILFTSPRKKPDSERMAGMLEAVARKFGKSLHTSVVDAETHAGRMAAAQFKVEEFPALVLDGEQIFSEKLPDEEELARLVEKKMAKSKTLGKKERSRYWSISGLPEQWGQE